MNNRHSTWGSFFDVTPTYSMTPQYSILTLDLQIVGQVKIQGKAENTEIAGGIFRFSFRLYY